MKLFVDKAEEPWKKIMLKHLPSTQPKISSKDSNSRKKTPTWREISMIPLLYSSHRKVQKLRSFRYVMQINKLVNN